MKTFTPFLCTVFSFCLLISFTSCYKGILEEITSNNEKETTITKMASDSSEVRKLLTAHTWQIEEVVDPFSGVRYKRGSVSDEKGFHLARYIYGVDGSIKGTDWFGNPIKDNFYSLQNGDKQFLIITPDCTSINEIISISSTKFVYKANDGSILTLTPIDPSDVAL
jgi:hypothetical protein